MLPEIIILLENAGVDLPNENSLGLRIVFEDDKTALADFWKWFGESVCVDDDGCPLVLYHGSQSEFTDFNHNNINKMGEKQSGADEGFFFTDNINIARRFMKSDNLDNECLNLIQDGFKTEDNLKEYEAILAVLAQLKFDASIYGSDDFVVQQGLKQNESDMSALEQITGKTRTEMSNFYQKLKTLREEIRSNRGKRESGLHKCYIKIENPLELDGDVIGVGVEREFYLRSAKANGYDGVIIYNADTGAGYGNEYIVFDNDNIRHC